MKVVTKQSAYPKKIQNLAYRCGDRVPAHRRLGSEKVLEDDGT